MATWPATLPDEFLEEGFSETLGDNTVRYQPDVGPPQLRRRATASPRRITGVMRMTAAQVDTHDTFYVTTLKDGSLSFDWNHPRTGAAATFIYSAPPVYQYRNGHWYVSRQLEILP